MVYYYYTCVHYSLREYNIKICSFYGIYFDIDLFNAYDMILY